MGGDFRYEVAPFWLRERDVGEGMTKNQDKKEKDDSFSVLNSLCFRLTKHETMRRFFPGTVPPPEPLV
jgi:hypothetical protein